MDVTRDVNGWHLYIVRRSFYSRGVWYFVVGRTKNGNRYWFSRHRLRRDAAVSMSQLDPDNTLHAIFC